MKKTIILLASAVLFSFVSTQAQKGSLISPAGKSARNADSKQYTALQDNPVNESIESIKIDLDQLKDLSSLSVQYDNKNYQVTEQRLEVRDVNNFSWIGYNDDMDGNIILSVLDNDVQGILTKGTDLYRISTVGTDEYAIAKIDQSQYPQEKCDNLENLEEFFVTTSEHDHLEDELSPIEASDNFETYDVTTPYICNIRVIVMYTPKAASLVSNIKNTIQLAVNETNQSFINSSVSHRLELAYVEKTTYTEVNTNTDLNRFAGTSDGYMDEVHALRTKYAADVCVLISDDPSYCGMAKTIGANASNSFCLVDYDCATGYYSFGHEIGHLLGCRHDTYVDNNTSPYSYGHGFVNVADKWRTVMSYNSKCSASGVNCTRIPYWSNPNKTYGGDAMGTTTTEYNAKVWNVNSNTIKAFRQPAYGVILSASDISNSLYGDVIARNYIQTSGNMTVNNGAELKLRATTRVSLKTGFKALPGSKFIAGTTPVANCNAADEQLKSAEKIEEPISDNNLNEFKFNIYPNPTKGVINIDYSLASENTVSIDLIDFLGKRVATISSKMLQVSGSHSIQFNAEQYGSGVYFIRFVKENEIINQRVILE